MDYKTILRHHLATLAFRTHYAINDSKENYANFSAGQNVRTPLEILEHMIQLVKGSFDIIQNERFSPIESTEWDKAKPLFFEYLKKLDEAIVEYDDSNDEMILSVFQGPMNDAMTHVGQLCTLRRLSGDPLKGLNYYREKTIKVGNFDY